MVRVLCLVIGYLFGLFQTAYVYGKRKGIDIREHGSGNAGTTNALRVFGTKAGILVFAGDCLKCILAVAFCRVLFERTYPDMQYLGIWHMPKTDAPYVCIEPWVSLPGRHEIIEEITCKSDMIQLAPNESWNTQWSIELI